ncbi:hypothetical protein G7B40_022255 [Aetokthonos hydrillicola Thurmond2011]|jgi:hypothetical protein|uniref:Uncharacterized protein n=1 Tax=Aetokthonos hydrillicola Thurmond2011 TaxID=2712845 RepID=A0AAP5I9A5_9CYAN|nr:hypothetical protein [Aetokthonos hydrillicola]MBO3460791.1 hypothetical protein [Aetokthonos hydrillicola CCALA 1050]MBW4588254.1 hypothetical protein [Aetokthonos hydrillicola CCALA 1050]MDR9897266.1 hypothetical protein [Aetokthonos hydrillicola Thurmond2011]
MTDSVITPSLASTFAFSQGELIFSNFSKPFSIIEKQNHGDAFPTSSGGVVAAQNLHAVINVTDKPPSASTSAVSQAFGNSRDYTGGAKTIATIIANFDIEAGKIFSFQFSTTLDLQTKIHDQKIEKSHVSGDISFRLFDTTDIPKQNLQNFLSSLLSDNATSSIKKSPLDFFILNGNLITIGNNDSIKYEKSPNILLNNGEKKFNVGGIQEAAKVSYKGSFQRAFAKETNLTLIALRRSEAGVAASKNPII